MSPQTAQCVANALALSEADRAAVAAALIASLDGDVDVDAEAAWGDEIQDRLAELDLGRVTPLSWTEARRLIREDTDEPHDR